VFQLAAWTIVSSILNLRNGVHKPCSNGPTVSYSFKHGLLVPQDGSWVPTHGDPWSTYMTNEIIHVSFKVIGNYSVNSHRACHNPKTLTGKIWPKNVAPCCNYPRYHKKWLGADFPPCFFSFSRALDISRSFRLIVQLHRLIHIGKRKKNFAKLFFQSNNL